MNEIMNNFINPFFYWLAWIIIPVLVEIIPSIASFFSLIIHRNKHKKAKDPLIWPDIVLVIPVYNSEKSLEQCLRSVDDSDYPNEHMEIFLVNNKSSDKSFEAFMRAQDRHPELRMSWMNSGQGKSRALNLAIYNSRGKYIINIDSDGMLEKSALTRMIRRMENEPEVTGLTGSILTTPEEIEEVKTYKGRLLRRIEFCEYAQAFLAGRNYASEKDRMYTMSGAFSAFRLDTIRKSHLYNTETISEDTELTFQMRYLLKEKVGICVDALFFTDPIDDVDKLYTQRQRWQRGSLEVARLYPQSKLKPWRFVKDVNVRTLLFDHTFAFPRMIWYLALIYLLMNGYSSLVVISSIVAMLLFYIFCGYLYFFIASYLLKPFPEIRKYYHKQWPEVALLPLYNFVVFFIRFAGIINSMNTRSTWKTETLTREWDKFSSTTRAAFGKLSNVLKRFRHSINYEDRYHE